MTIKEIIEQRLSELSSTNKDAHDTFFMLWREINDVIENSNQHLKLIIAQMRNYDIHDESHSNKVLENIENILLSAFGRVKTPSFSWQLQRDFSTT
jgi:D-lyxose ketol-isomerase